MPSYSECLPGKHAVSIRAANPAHSSRTALTSSVFTVPPLLSVWPGTQKTHDHALNRMPFMSVNCATVNDTDLARRMPDPIDFDTGLIITASKTVEQIGEDMLELVIATASGTYPPPKPSRSARTTSPPEVRRLIVEGRVGITAYSSFFRGFLGGIASSPKYSFSVTCSQLCEVSLTWRRGRTSSTSSSRFIRHASRSVQYTFSVS